MRLKKRDYIRILEHKVNQLQQENEMHRVLIGDSMQGLMRLTEKVKKLENSIEILSKGLKEIEES